MAVYPFAGIADPFSSLSHFIGALVCARCSTQLIRAPGLKEAQRLALGVFCFGCITLLTMSGVYHLLPHGAARDILQRADHAAIFILIAGTFTPIHSILFRGFWRWGPLVMIWGCAVIGILLKTIFFSSIPEVAGISMYLGMGWLGALTGGLAWSQRGFSFIRPLLNGALAYSGGTIFEFMHSPNLVPGVIGPHELFHLAVLAGMAYHWKFIASCLASLPDATRDGDPGAEGVLAPEYVAAVTGK